MLDAKCMPACAACIRADECKKEWKKPEPKSHFEDWYLELEQRTPITSKLQLAMIEGERARYIELICEHLTSWEEQEAYVAFRPKSKPKSLYCEKCTKWVLRMPAPKYEPPPLEPMF